MSGRSIDHDAATTINHRLAAVAGLFTFRSMRDPEVRNPIPSGHEARRVCATERNAYWAPGATEKTFHAWPGSADH
jgi:integrase/recombinase XerD